MLLNGLAEAALRTRRSNSSCSLALANSALASLAAIEWPAPLPPSVRACSSRAPLARQSVEQVVPLWRLRASACGGSQCCGEIAREGSARMSVTTSAAAVCTPPPHRAHCARCDGDVLCVGGRRPLRRVGGGSGSKAAWREAAEAVGRTARQRQGRGSGGLGGSGSRCNRPRRARATMCSACVRLGGGRTPRWHLGKCRTIWSARAAHAPRKFSSGVRSRGYVTRVMGVKKVGVAEFITFIKLINYAISVTPR